MKACRRGETLYDTKANVATPFTSLLDSITLAAALQGDISGFDGRTLEVSRVHVWHLYLMCMCCHHCKGTCVVGLNP